VANRHFAKLGDVWKHLGLVQVLAIDRPARYWESHAGSAVYAMVDDAEREYGIRRFAEAAPGFAALASSRYLAHVSSVNDSPGNLLRYPGSAMLAMLELGASCAYLFSDKDPASVGDLKAASTRLGHEAQVYVRDRDGMTEDRHALVSVRPGEAVIAHLDPYDPWAAEPGGLSALDLAAELIHRRIGLVYWYGYDRPGQRAWAFDTLSARGGNIWCGDVMITSDSGVYDDGDFGAGSTPGTGCGVVCANLSPDAIGASQRLGEELAAAYDGAPLPNSMRGRLDFTFRTAGAAQ
jgi:hypothetical protein